MHTFVLKCTSVRMCTTDKYTHRYKITQLLQMLTPKLHNVSLPTQKLHPPVPAPRPRKSRTAASTGKPEHAPQRPNPTQVPTPHYIIYTVPIHIPIITDTSPLPTPLYSTHRLITHTSTHQYVTPAVAHCEKFVRFAASPRCRCRR